jgi:hypothetical protein
MKLFEFSWQDIFFKMGGPNLVLLLFPKPRILMLEEKGKIRMGF